ncbi:DUF6193 family natural product biosynthesis protein [Streptomyces monticola]|uniref:DUF6193 family natural product biosynthesis protein n=1 Tax=Streptomyces monticola TaxID=2666263 RepID=A0ABW2JL47_9ACTN
MHFSALAEAHEHGHAAAVAAQWNLIREQAARAPDFPEFGLLVDAAHAEPRLRQLFPFSSHWTLGFRAYMGVPTPAEVAIVPSNDGHPYRVQKYPHGGVIGEARTTQETVVMAAAPLPAGCRGDRRISRVMGGTRSARHRRAQWSTQLALVRPALNVASR